MDDDFASRFGGVGRLLSRPVLDRLRRSHVCVIGIGGVGSWTVEALARSGIGQLTLIDLDEVCVSNVNRQLHALAGQVGRPKVSVMAERIAQINPEAVVREESVFYTRANAAALLGNGFDCVVDAIDHGKTKAHLIAECRAHSLPVVTCGGAGGRRDPTLVRVADLTKSFNDSLLHQVRKVLRQEYGFPRGKKKFDVRCVFSEELPVYPGSDGSTCRSPEPGVPVALNCESGFGTAAWLTGAFGFAAAAATVGLIEEAAAGVAVNSPA